MKELTLKLSGHLPTGRQCALHSETLRSMIFGLKKPNNTTCGSHPFFDDCLHADSRATRFVAHSTFWCLVPSCVHITFQSTARWHFRHRHMLYECLKTSCSNRLFFSLFSVSVFNRSASPKRVNCGEHRKNVATDRQCVPSRTP